MKNGEWLSETQLDYLEEMMNVGVCHAADVFSQMLRTRIEVKIPVVHAMPMDKTASIIFDPDRLVFFARMELFGDIKGVMCFMMADDQKENFLRLIERSTLAMGTQGEKPGNSAHPARSVPVDSSVIPEIGNILAGSYLSAIQRFCSLSIAHSVPNMAVNTYQSLLDEDLVSLRRFDWKAIVVENVFHIENPVDSVVEQVKTYLLMIPHPESVGRLAMSIDEARHRASGA